MKNITYPVCEECNKTLLEPDSGYVLYGQIFRAEQERKEPMVSSWKEGEEEDPGIALCQTCFAKRLTPEHLKIHKVESEKGNG